MSTGFSDGKLAGILLTCYNLMVTEIRRYCDVKNNCLIITRGFSNVLSHTSATPIHCSITWKQYPLVQ